MFIFCLDCFTVCFLCFNVFLCRPNDFLSSCLFCVVGMGLVAWNKTMVWSAEKQVYDFQLTSISTTLSCLQLFSRVPHSFLFQQNPQYVQPFPSSCWFFYHFTFNNILIRPSCLRTHRSHLCFRRQMLSKIYSFLSVCHLILPLFINFFFYVCLSKYQHALLRPIH